MYDVVYDGRNEYISFTCDNCKSDVLTRYNCTLCDVFDLCVICKDKISHPHPMEKIDFDLDYGSSSLVDVTQTQPRGAQRLSILRWTEALAHACQCSDADCSLLRCQKIKEMMTHTNNCEKKIGGGCLICKQFIDFCGFHAATCQETIECFVPFCSYIRHRIRLRQERQARLLRWGMTVRPNEPVGAVDAEE